MRYMGRGVMTHEQTAEQTSRGKTRWKNKNVVWYAIDHQDKLIP